MFPLLHFPALSLQLPTRTVLPPATVNLCGWEKQIQTGNSSALLGGFLEPSFPSPSPKEWDAKLGHPFSCQEPKFSSLPV